MNVYNRWNEIYATLKDCMKQHVAMKKQPQRPSWLQYYSQILSSVAVLKYSVPILKAIQYTSNYIQYQYSTGSQILPSVSVMTIGNPNDLHIIEAPLI